MKLHMMESGHTYRIVRDGDPETPWTCPYFVQIGLRDDGPDWLEELVDGEWMPIGALAVSLQDVHDRISSRKDSISSASARRQS